MSKKTYFKNPLNSVAQANFIYMKKKYNILF